MSNSNYSIGLQRLKPVHTAYMPIRKLLMHWSWARDVSGRDRNVETETTTMSWGHSPIPFLPSSPFQCFDPLLSHPSLSIPLLSLSPFCIASWNITHNEITPHLLASKSITLAPGGNKFYPVLLLTKNKTNYFLAVFRKSCEKYTQFFLD